jgi:catechol 2,3-dioxygenase-like lactoylglutathione lyase family enzyme
MLTLSDTTVDIGLFSDNPNMPSWYPDVLGAPLAEVIEHSPTYQERFYSVGAGCLKINYSTEVMPTGTSGYRELLLGRDGLEQRQTFQDPDGLVIRLVPRHELGGGDLGIVMGVADPDAQADFFGRALGATESAGGLCLGDVRFFFEFEPEASRPSPTWSRGFKYYVLFVEDAPASHRELLAHGAEHGLRPLRLADRCIFSWLRDPSGNWFELVQRAAPGRPLEPVDRADEHWEDIVRWRTQGIAS